MAVIFFSDQLEFRKWLTKNHKKETEIIVGYYKKATGKPSMTWPESVDQALCFGWIDGIRRSIDEESYCIRFTPRKSNSNWSTVNIKKVEDLTKKGLMKPEGLALFNNRQEDKSAIYSYEKHPAELPPELEKLFKRNKAAWKFFSAQPPYYRKSMIYWVVSAKREETKISRLEKLIASSENQKRIT